jgi:hypothetical protein
MINPVGRRVRMRNMSDAKPQAATPVELRTAMAGKASDAKTADGDAPVFA